MAKRPARTDPCGNCMRHHEPPVCSWDPEASCPRCGLQACFKGDDKQEGVCYWCWSGFPRRGAASAGA
jgi:hypothetical protein